MPFYPVTQDPQQVLLSQVRGAFVHSDPPASLIAMVDPGSALLVGAAYLLGTVGQSIVDPVLRFTGAIIRKLVLRIYHWWPGKWRSRINPLRCARWVYLGIRKL